MIVDGGTWGSQSFPAGGSGGLFAGRKTDRAGKLPGIANRTFNVVGCSVQSGLYFPDVCEIARFDFKFHYSLMNRHAGVAPIVIDLKHVGFGRRDYPQQRKQARRAHHRAGP